MVWYVTNLHKKRFSCLTSVYILTNFNYCKIGRHAWYLRKQQNERNNRLHHCYKTRLFSRVIKLTKPYLPWTSSIKPSMQHFAIVLFWIFFRVLFFCIFKLTLLRWRLCYISKEKCSIEAFLNVWNNGNDLFNVYTSVIWRYL